MDYSELSDILGGSIFQDDFRGNFGDISNDINGRLLVASGRSQRELSEVRLLEAAFRMIQGDFAAAKELLASLLSNAKLLDETFVRRCKTYKFRLASLACQPSALRFCGTIENTAAMIITAPLNMLQNLREMENVKNVRIATSFSPVERSAAMENKLFASLHTFTTEISLSLFSHPRHTSGHFASLASLHKSPITFESLLKSAQQSGLDTTRFYLQRLMLERQIALDDDQATDMIIQLRRECFASNDTHGAALTWMIQGDFLCSEPFTSPIALNLIAKTRGMGWDEEDWDLTDFPNFLKRSESAEKCYNRASELMKKASAERGEAAVLLRMGCMSHAEAVALPITDKNCQHHMQEARRYFEDAKKLFFGDLTHLRIIECHEVLLRVAEVASHNPLSATQVPERKSVIDQAKALGGLTKKQGDARLAQFLGALMLRLGRKYFVTFRKSAVASLCCDCAAALFQAAEDNFMWLQALIAHADLLEQLSNIDQALLKITEVRVEPEGPLSLALGQIRSLLQDADSRSTFTATYNNVLSNVDRLAGKVYTAAARPDLAASWLELRGRLELELSNSIVHSDVSSEIQTSSSDGGSIGKSNVDLSQLTLQLADPGLNLDPDNLDLKGVMSLLNQKTKILKDMLGVATAAQAIDVRSQNDRPQRASGQTRISFASQDELVRTFNEATAISYNHLDRADVDNWNGVWHDFVQKCNVALRDGSLNAEQVSLYKLIACSNCGDLETARSALAEALPHEFRDNAKRSLLDEIKARAHTVGMASQQEKWKAQAAERAISLCVLAQAWSKGLQVLEQTSVQLSRYQNPETMSNDPRAWLEASFVGQVYEHNGQPDKAFAWYLNAMQRLRSLVDSADVDARHESHSTIHSNELFAGLSRMCLKFAEQTGASQVSPAAWGLACADWENEAVSFLEKGRARALIDLLVAKGGVEPKDLSKWSNELYRRRLEILARSSEVFHQAKRHAMSKEDIKKRLNEPPQYLSPEQLAIASMQQTSKASFVGPEFYKCIPADTLVLETFANRQETGVICITTDGVQAIHRRHDLSDIHLRSLVLRWVRLIDDLRRAGIETPQNEIESRKNDIITSSQTISDAVLSECRKMIESHDNVVIVPSHSLQRFPCSAYVMGGEPLFDRKVVYQIPSLSALSAIAPYADRVEPQVCDAKTAIFASNKAITHKPKIPFSVAGTASISQIVGTELHNMDDLSVAQLRASFSSHDVVFVSTHGSNVFDLGSSPWQSYLEGNDGRLRIVDLASLSKCAALVVFSACWAGLGTTTAGSDILGFSHAVLASGAKVFIGGVWPLDSVIATILMVLFARELMETESGSTVATAWNTAMRKLYHLGKKEYRQVLEDVRKACELASSDKGTAFADFHMLGSCVSRAIADSEKFPVDFTRPDHWAGYSIVGQGGLPFRRSSDGKRFGQKTPVGR